MIKTYKIFVEWAVGTTVDIKADTLADAIRQIEEDLKFKYPTKGQVIDGSQCVNIELSRRISSNLEAEKVKKTK